MKFTRNKLFCLCSLLLSCSLFITLVSPSYAIDRANSVESPTENKTSDANENQVRPPLYFEENRGQFDERVRYLSRANGQTIFLTATEMVYVVRNTEVPSSKFQVPRLDNRNPQSAIRNPQSKATALYVRLANAQSNSPFEGVEELEGRLNYFRGNNPANWQTNVRTFSRVNYEGVYRGVDMSFYSNGQGEFEYDFIVKPNADANQISLEVEGAQDVRVKENGDLEIETEAGTITQRKPFTYQTTTENLKEEVSSQWSVVSGQTRTNPQSAIRNPQSFIVKFNIGNYDTNKPLIIDPSVPLNNLSYSTFAGGLQNDISNDIAVDGAGNVHVTGRTLSPLFPTTSGAFDPTQNGSGFEDVFVTKINASGTGLIYSTFLGGPFYDEGLGIAVDANQNVYVSGIASSSFPTTAGAFDTTFNGGSDVFVTKLNAAGTALVYSTYIGASNTDSVNDLAIDANNNVYIAGRTSDTVVDYPTTAGAFDTTHNGVDDAFLTKLNDTGTALVYSTFIGGSHIDVGVSIAVDGNQEAYIAGTATDDVTDLQTTAGAYDTTHNGVTDFFVAKFNASGSALVYSTFIGGAGIDNCNGLTIDNAGNAYLTGSISAGFPTTAGVVDTTAAGSGEGGLSKISADGSTLVYSTYFGGTQGEQGRGVAVDSIGNAYVAGDTFGAGNDYPITAGAYDTTYNGSNDTILTVFNTTATAYLYSTYFGGSGSEFGNDIALDSSGNVYLTGQTASAATNLPTTINAYQTMHAGGTDVYIAKFGDFVIAGRTVDANGSPISGAAVSLSGNVSDVKLTDAQGYFGFTDTEPGENFTVAASRNGVTFNPALFNITGLARNKQLVFIGTAGAPTGFPGGVLRVFPTYSTNERSGFITLAVERTDVFNQNIVTVDYKTSAVTATANVDYTHRQGTLTFLPLELVKTIEVPITNDTQLEQAETFNFTLSNPTGTAALSENITAQVTIEDDDTTNGDVIISEFRARGASGAKDEFVELYNNTDQPLIVSTNDGSNGWTLAAVSANGSVTPIFSINEGQAIPARGHFLATNSDTNNFSLQNYPSGAGFDISANTTFAGDIEDNKNLVLFRTTDPAHFNNTYALDAVCFDTNPIDSICEGKALPSIGSDNGQYSFVRRIVNGSVQDTNDNLADFVFVSTNGGQYGDVLSTLGSPAPEGLFSLRLQRNEDVSITPLFINGASEFQDPMAVTNGAQGTLTLYRTITNNTAQAITRLRLRVTDITAGVTRSSKTPDLRVLSSSAIGSLQGATLDASALQPNGGGLNSSLSITSITPDAPLQAGESISVRIILGVQRWGRWRFNVVAELP